MALTLPAIFSDGMVLQRGKPVIVRGNAAPNAVVEVELGGECVTVTSDDNGTFLAELQPRAAGEAAELTVAAQGETITVRDVLFGDVWLCSGQSNMVLPISRVKNMYPSELNAENALIRQFKAPDAYAFDGARDDFSPRGNGWERVSPATVGGFSAVAYFFARELFARHGVPIGLYVSAVGGSRVHAWTRREDLGDFPELVAESEAFAGMTAPEFAVDAPDSERADWSGVDLDDADWSERELDDAFDDDLLKPGVVWFRKTLDVPPSLANKPATLYLGTLTDADETYVNGKIVGGTTYRYPPREYAVPPLTVGKCVVAVRLTIGGNDGGFTYGKQRLLNIGGVSFDLNSTWKYRRESYSEPIANLPPNLNYIASGLYNAMVAPLRFAAITGVIWYQGESDDGNPCRYDERFRALIRGWRELWGEDFPFLFAELAHYRSGGEEWRSIRRQQKSALTLPKTGMAATFDLGEHNDLHPLNKKAVAERLARLALQLAYGEDMPPSPFCVVLGGGE
ncbi:MAG: hypothetical protein LBN30_03815 [Oscillospiraceae bacterium]|jgi:sialate O-acetylesterase|nr:hypothetical protein [Oscillospiraceae bacterium]